MARTTSRAVVCVLAGALAGCFLACVPPEGDSADASTDGPVSCGSETCSEAQICLYRACTYEDRCVPRTTCPSGTTPADCGGKPGCLVPAESCAPILSGCRAIPESCGGDPQCACESICGSAPACSGVSGRTALCKGST